MQLLSAITINCKNDLYALYLNKFPLKTLREAIHKIQLKTKKDFKGKNVNYSQLVSIRDVLIFIKDFDCPSGYKLNDEMQYRFDAYKAELFSAKCLRYDRAQAALKEEVNKNLEKLKKDDEDKLV
jgi:hypothetical protein